MLKMFCGSSGGGSSGGNSGLILEYNIYTTGSNAGQPMYIVTDYDSSKNFIHYNYDQYFIYDGKVCTFSNNSVTDCVHPSFENDSNTYIDYAGNASASGNYSLFLTSMGLLYAYEGAMGNIAEISTSCMAIYAAKDCTEATLSQYRYAFYKAINNTYSFNGNSTHSFNTGELNVSNTVYNNLTNSSYAKEQQLALAYNPTVASTEYTLFTSNSSESFVGNYSLNVIDAVGTLSRNTSGGDLSGKILLVGNNSGVTYVYNIRSTTEISTIQYIGTNAAANVKLLTPNMFYRLDEKTIYFIDETSANPVLNRVVAADGIFAVDEDGVAYKITESTNTANVAAIGDTTNGKYVDVKGNCFVKELN